MAKSTSKKLARSANVDRRAYAIGTVKGRTVYRIPVRVALNDSRRCATVDEHWYRVIAYSPADAANWVKGLYATRAETEIFAYGVNGGETHRYIGWDSATWAAMCDRPNREQLGLWNRYDDPTFIAGGAQ